MNTLIKSNIISKRSINVLWAQIILLRLPGGGGVAQLESTHLCTQSPGFYSQQNGIPTEPHVWDFGGGGRKVRSASSRAAWTTEDPTSNKNTNQTETFTCNSRTIRKADYTNTSDRYRSNSCYKCKLRCVEVTQVVVLVLWPIKKGLPFGVCGLPNL